MAGQTYAGAIDRRQALRTLGGGATLAGLMLAQRVSPGSAGAEGQADTTTHPIIGAWATAAASTTAGVTANLLSFVPGGIVLHAASNFPQSGGMGTWAVQDERTILYSLIYRRQDKATGAYIGSTRLDARVTLDPDQFSCNSTFSTTLTNAAGEVTSRGTGSSRATRIVVTPPLDNGSSGLAPRSPAHPDGW